MIVNRLYSFAGCVRQRLRGLLMKMRLLEQKSLRLLQLPEAFLQGFHSRNVQFDLWLLARGELFDEVRAEVMAITLRRSQEISDFVVSDAARPVQKRSFTGIESREFSPEHNTASLKNIFRIRLMRYERVDISV